jgi:hypothetical protein
MSGTDNAVYSLGIATYVLSRLDCYYLISLEGLLEGSTFLSLYFVYYYEAFYVSGSFLLCSCPVIATLIGIFTSTTGISSNVAVFMVSAVLMVS